MQILKHKDFDTLSRSQNSWSYKMREKGKEAKEDEIAKERVKDMPSYKSYGEYQAMRMNQKKRHSRSVLNLKTLSGEQEMKSV